MDIAPHETGLWVLRRVLGAARERNCPIVHIGAAGALDVPDEIVAAHDMLDSYGQETTILFCGLRSFDEIHDDWCDRGTVFRSFEARYPCSMSDLADLAFRLDHTVRPLTFDLDEFARRRGLRPIAVAAG